MIIQLKFSLNLFVETKIKNNFLKGYMGNGINYFYFRSNFNNSFYACIKKKKTRHFNICTHGCLFRNASIVITFNMSKHEIFSICVEIDDRRKLCGTFMLI